MILSDIEKLKVIDKVNYTALDNNGYGEQELDYLVTYFSEEMPRLKPNLQEVSGIEYYPIERLDKLLEDIDK